MSFFVGLLYATLLINHLVNNSHGYKDICQGDLPVPCFLLYSRFDQINDQYYALSLILFMVLGLNISINKWVAFDVLRKKRELYEDKQKKFSKIFLNCWDWKTANNNYEAHELATSLRMELKVNLDEERIKAIIQKRSNFEKTKLFVRRSITLFLSTVLLLGGWTGIIALSLYEKDI